ncbi:acyltransferase [Akkermansiaceae bacterium]|nr:acyltransferase [Akkermansiaceae bacterium]
MMSLRTLIRDLIQRRRLSRKGVQVGEFCKMQCVHFKGPAVIDPFCRLIGDPCIEIGKNFYINGSCHLLGDITIGENVLIGPHSVIWGRDHCLDRGLLIREQGHVRKPIRIGDDCWIGANVTILKGVTLGTGSVVGAGSVVVKDVPDYAIVVGSPAKIVRYRD